MKLVVKCKICKDTFTHAADAINHVVSNHGKTAKEAQSKHLSMYRGKN